MLMLFAMGAMDGVKDSWSGARHCRWLRIQHRHGRAADHSPNNFVGDLVHTERGRVVVPPTCCPTATLTTSQAAQSGAHATAGPPL